MNYNDSSNTFSDLNNNNNNNNIEGNNNNSNILLDHSFTPNSNTSMNDFFTSNQQSSSSNGYSNNTFSAINTTGLISNNYNRSNLPMNLLVGSGINHSHSNLNDLTSGSLQDISPEPTHSQTSTREASIVTSTSLNGASRKSGRKTISSTRGIESMSMDDYTDSEEERMEFNRNSNSNSGRASSSTGGGGIMMLDSDSIGGGSSSIRELGDENDLLTFIKPTKVPKKTKATTTTGATTAATKGKGKAKLGKKALAAAAAAAAAAASAAENGGGSIGGGSGGGFDLDDESEFEGKKVKSKQRKTSGDKKKKAGRACAACQKAHLTCDDARPCARCVKKNCAADCHDGARKKAKYLQEVPDELLERRPPPPQKIPSPVPIIDNSNSIDSEDSPHGIDQLSNMNHSQLQQPPFSFDSLPYYDPNSFSQEFGSEAANLEYAILSSMLNGNGFQVDGYGNTGLNQNNQDVRLNGSGNGSTMLGMNSPGNMENSLGPIASGSGSNNHLTSSNHTSGYNSIFDRTTGSSATSPAGGLHFGGNGLNGLSPGLAGLSPGLAGLSPSLMEAVTGTISSTSTGINGNLNETNSRGLESLITTSTTTNPNSIISNKSNNNPEVAGLNSSTLAAGMGGRAAESSGAYLLDPKAHQPKKEYPGRTAQSTKMLTAEEAYRTVTKPYSYAQSYHYLVRHLKERIIRSFDTFIHILFSIQMPLTEEDETFVERTFQRTLIELNKLISFSGTPTVVWRRTGEICLVGTEFCLLTGWTREELLGKKYIFELFDTSSVVEYYESFAKHAFESTSPSVMTQCVVVGPSGRPVPCAFCFSVRRDLFSLPFIVIGSFLPVL